MVLASMYGSRASNGYGSGGTVNATGFSSDCEFEMGFLVSASNRPGTAPPAPISPAPTMPVPVINLRRLMAASKRARATRRTCGLYRYIADGSKPPLAEAPKETCRQISSLSLDLDAREGPKGRVRYHRVLRGGKTLQQFGDPVIGASARMYF